MQRLEKKGLAIDFLSLLGCFWAPLQLKAMGGEEDPTSPGRHTQFKDALKLELRSRLGKTAGRDTKRSS